MKAPTFNRLVTNLKRDGVLTSVPTIYGDEVLSGNHRVQAAIKAGIEEADCLEIVGELGEDQRTTLLTQERQVAIQLSHNALVGEDDPSLLVELYGGLPLDEKLYSGLTDDQLRLPDEIDLATLSAGATDFEEIRLVFLPEEAQAFKRFVDLLGKRTGRAADVQVMVAALEDFAKVFDTAVATKMKLNIMNTAMAFRAMAQLAAERLEQLSPESDNREVASG